MSSPTFKLHPPIDPIFMYHLETPQREKHVPVDFSQDHVVDTRSKWYLEQQQQQESAFNMLAQFVSYFLIGYGLFLSYIDYLLTCCLSIYILMGTRRVRSSKPTWVHFPNQENKGHHSEPWRQLRLPKLHVCLLKGRGWRGRRRGWGGRRRRWW